MVNRPAAPRAVVEDLEKGVALIAAQPECGTPVKSARARGVRRVYLARLGYYLYYRVAGRAHRGRSSPSGTQRGAPGRRSDEVAAWKLCDSVAFDYEGVRGRLSNAR